MVDPPWPYRDKLTMSTVKRGAASHYSVMTLDELAALPVGQWAASDAHLYLWTTNAFMRQAHELAEAWGFRPKTIVTWVKNRLGMGAYYRNTTEHAVFCTRGSMRVLRHDVPTHFEAPVTGHSAKPDAFYRIVEQVSPGPYLDVFARTERPRWSVYGDQVESDIPLVG